MEGGLEELEEFWPRRASNAEMRRSKDWTKARTAACTSDGVLS